MRRALWVLPLGLAVALVVLVTREEGERPRAAASATRVASTDAAPLDEARPTPALVAPAAPMVPEPAPPLAHAAPASDNLTRPSSPELYWQKLEELGETDKGRALDYALKGEEWYPSSGKLAEALRAMTITLLVDLGRMPEARERTRAFIAQYPDSPYRRLAQGVTGIHPRPGPPGRSPELR